MRHIRVGYIHITHNFKTGHQALMKCFWENIVLMQDAINPIIDPHQIGIRLHVDITGSQDAPFFYQQISKPYYLILIKLSFRHPGARNNLNVLINCQGRLIIEFYGV